MFGAVLLIAADTDETRGATPLPEPATAAPTGRAVVVTIGIDQYTHWRKLDNAVSDAVGFHEILTEKFGFEAPVPPLLNEKATGEAVMDLFQDTLREKLKPEDRLVIFFAGHGHTVEKLAAGKKREVGYLVPVDAHHGRKEKLREFLRVDNVLEAISELPPRHILVVLDACHSGVALGEAAAKHRDGGTYEASLASKVSRRVITSARREQLALDSGPIAGHSLFTGTLIEGLTWGGADLDANGLVTSSELGLFVEQRVGQASDSRQTPDFGSFEADERGELVLSLRDTTPTALGARARAAFNGGKLDEFRTLAEKLRTIAPDAPMALFHHYRTCLQDRDIQCARKAATALSAGDWPAGAIPLSRNDLMLIQARLRYYAQPLAKLETSSPLKFEIRVARTPDDPWKDTKASALGDLSGVSVPRGAIVKLEVENTSDKAQYIYLVSVDPAGRIEPAPWRRGPPRLAPGETATSDPLRFLGEPGLETMWFVTSETEVYDMDRPPSHYARKSLAPVWVDGPLKVAPVFVQTRFE